jgi:hypothetical protein
MQILKKQINTKGKEAKRKYNSNIGSARGAMTNSSGRYANLVVALGRLEGAAPRASKTPLGVHSPGYKLTIRRNGE